MYRDNTSLVSGGTQLTACATRPNANSVLEKTLQPRLDQSHLDGCIPSYFWNTGAPDPFLKTPAVIGVNGNGLPQGLGGFQLPSLRTLCSEEFSSYHYYIVTQKRRGGIRPFQIQGLTGAGKVLAEEGP